MGLASGDRPRLDILGRGVVLDSDDVAAVETLLAAWSRCKSSALPREDDVVLSPEQVDDYVHQYQPDALAMRLTAEGIQAGVGRQVMLHAAAVSDRTGAVAALIGPSGSGKTTAAMHLTRHRLGYVTDELVSIGPAGDVSPFPRPLFVEVAGSNHWGKSQHAPDELGLQPCVEPLRLTRLVLLDRDPDSPRTPAVEPVPLLDGLMEVIAQTSSLYTLAEPLQRLCRLVDACGGLLRVKYTEVADIEDLVIDLLSEPASAAQEWIDPGNRPVPEGSVAWGLMDGRVRRKSYLDAVQVDDEVLVMIGGTPVKLTGIGVTIWTHAAAAPSVDELVALVVADHGPHPDAEKLVRDAVTALAGADVLGYDRPHPLVDAVAHPDEDLLPKPPQGPAGPR
jgi:hypothetical protein